MTVQACIKCRDITQALGFYTEVLDFKIVVAPDPDPKEFMSKYALMERNGSKVHLSSHAGDGVFGNLIYVRVDDIDSLYEEFVERGLQECKGDDYPGVTIKPVVQTWAMKEFSIRDHDGNKITYGENISS